MTNMAGPIANIAGEVAALTGRLQSLLASLPDNTFEYAELAAVCHRHGIHERAELGETDDQGNPIRHSLAESLDLTLSAAVKKARRHDELSVALTEAQRAARDAQGEIDRARRDGTALLSRIEDARHKLNAAGFNTEATGWQAALDDALGELDAWRTGRRRPTGEAVQA